MDCNSIQFVETTNTLKNNNNNDDDNNNNNNIKKGLTKNWDPRPAKSKFGTTLPLFSNNEK